MRTPLFILLIFGFVQMVSAQTAAEIKNLRETFGPEKVNWLVENRPERVAFMAYQNSLGYYVAEVPPEKEVTFTGRAADIESLYPQLPPVTDQLIESGQWGMLGYDLGQSSNSTYYSMDNGKMLVVLPETLIRRLFEQNKLK